MVKRWSVGVALALCMIAIAAAKNPYPSIGAEAPRGKTLLALRGRGPEGLAAVLKKYDALERHHNQLQEKMARAKSADDSTVEIARIDEQLDKWRAVIDYVGGQRSCAVSRLYWYTDLAEAQAEAKQTGRPILSLRMLGKLTDEFSCANSRFFRTALYSNKDISNYLRDHFVLHWQSVRPVPRVTIDFGDGRKLERTLTGNSAHYILSSDGTPLDVLPGLYSPRAFRSWLARMEAFHGRYTATADGKRAQKLTEFHAARRQQVVRSWANDIERLGEQPATLVAARIEQATESARLRGGDTPLAKAAARLAVAKTRAETPLLQFANFSGPWIETSMDDELWQAVADLHRGEAKLDNASVVVMRKEFPQAEIAGKVSATKMIQEDPILRVVQTFENSIALDTVRNEYLLHRRIHERFAEGNATTTDIDTLNEWVYAELFLTPSSDPWLGLAPPDVYTALEGDGRIVPATDRLTRRE